MDRVERMSHYGVYQCPDWCTQDAADEPQYEAHLTPWYTLTTSGGDVFYVRGLAGWASLHQGVNDLRTTELIVAAAEVSPRLSRDEAERYGIELMDGSRYTLTANDWIGLQTIQAQAEMDLAAWLDHGNNPACDWQWAYYGADQDHWRATGRDVAQ